MRIRLQLLFFIAAIGAFSFLDSSVLKKVITVSYVEEEVDGISFVTQVHKVNDTVKKVWQVDEEDVPERQFEKILAAAKSREFLKEHRHEEQLRIQEQEALHNLKGSIKKQEIRISLKNALDSIIKTLAEFKRCSLDGYYKFSEDTIADHHALQHLLSVCVPKAKIILREQLDELSLQELQSFSKEFIQYSYCLKQFFLDSIKNAVNTCSDTKALKRYLELLS
ncbi:hypothetical protein HN446_03695 [bacterium]|nr:hypothetical protein [bacterium]